MINPRRSKFTPLATKKTRHQESVADRVQLGSKVRMGTGIPIDKTDQGAGQEGAKDRLQAEAHGQCDKADQQQHRHPDSDLGGAVLEPEQHATEMHRTAGSAEYKPK